MPSGNIPFRPILDRKPIKAIVITHFHTDHSFGIEAFIRGREGEVKIYAHDTYDKHCEELVNVRAMATFKRSMRQFGTLLKKGEHENSGIGPCLKQVLYRVTHHVVSNLLLTLM